ncbi:glyoxalase superfamily protein [Pseudomonas syringae pv. actinidiae]|nr:glyoxalase superfamily protein [Pseudomonas syringae pv. actinidiae]
MGWRIETPKMTNIPYLKAQAKRLRTHFAKGPSPITHAQALEAIAALHGYADWNTASAAIEAARKERKTVRAHIPKDLTGHQIHDMISGLLRMAPDIVAIYIHDDASQEQVDEAMKCIVCMQNSGHEAHLSRYSDEDSLQPGVSITHD